MLQKTGRFRRILRTREQEREIVQAELEAHRQREEEMVDRLRRLDEERSQALEEFFCAAEGACSVRDLWFGRQRIDCIENRSEEKQAELRGVRTTITETEARLLEQHRQVQMLEKYVGRLEESDRAEVLRVEQAALDDMSSMRHRFKRVTA